METYKISMSEEKCSKSLSSTEDALYVLGGKWTLRIMIAILGGHTRFNDIQRRVSGISARVLSSELKKLELNHLVERNVMADTKLVIVEYIHTEYSRSLKSIMDALSDWGSTHKKKITSTLVIDTTE